MKMRLMFLSAACAVILLPQLAMADQDEIRSYLSAAAETSYLLKGGNGLELTEPHRHLTNSVVFQKTIDGIDLYGSRVIVVLDSDGEVTEVIDETSENLERNIGQPKVDRAMAEFVISSGLTDMTATASSSQLVWFRNSDSAELAWEVTTQLEDTDAVVSPSHLVSIVDIETAEILSQTQHDDRNYYADPDAGVYPRIVINNAIGVAGARAYALPFDAVVEVDFGCTGVLISPNTVLCARHCGVGPGDLVRFGSNMNAPIFTRTVQSSSLPDGGGTLLDGGDVSILRLTANVPSNIAEPMRLIDQTSELVGQLCSLVGYGYNGLGSQGHNFTSDNRRWGGENIIDRYGNPPGTGAGQNIISTDFDNGSGGANTIPGSSPVPVEYEATTAPGDSGGPVMISINDEWLVAGVLSGGTTSNSVYGDISWWTGTAIYRTQIEANGGEFWEDEPVYLGDVNCDGVVNLLDIAPFVAMVGNGVFFDKADINRDGVVNLLDVDGFIELLSD